MLKRVGFFCELPHGDADGPSIRQPPGSTEYEPGSVASYLRGASILVAAMGPARDVLAAAPRRIDPPHVMTDGEWVWPQDLAHYVSEYRVPLPESFIAHVRQRQGKPRELSPEELACIALAEAQAAAKRVLSPEDPSRRAGE